MQVKCDCCGKTTQKRPGEIKLWTHHFCNRDCYEKWRSENHIFPNVVHYNRKCQNKLKLFAIKYAEKRSNG